MNQDLISLLYFIMFGPKLFWFAYNARIPEKDKQKKVELHRMSHIEHMQLLPAVSVRGASKPVFVPEHQKFGNLAKRMLLSLGYHGL